MDAAAIYAAFLQLPAGQQETLLLDLHDAHYHPTYESYQAHSLRPAGPNAVRPGANGGAALRPAGTASLSARAGGATAGT